MKWAHLPFSFLFSEATLCSENESSWAMVVIFTESSALSVGSVCPRHHLCFPRPARRHGVLRLQGPKPSVLGAALDSAASLVYRWGNRGRRD